MNGGAIRNTRIVVAAAVCFGSVGLLSVPADAATPAVQITGQFLA